MAGLTAATAAVAYPLYNYWDDISASISYGTENLPEGFDPTVQNDDGLTFDWERAKDDIQPLIDSAVDGVNAGVNACADGVYGCIDGAVDVISGRLDDYKSARRAEKRA